MNGGLILINQIKPALALSLINNNQYTYIISAKYNQAKLGVNIELVSINFEI